MIEGSCYADLNCGTNQIQTTSGCVCKEGYYKSGDETAGFTCEKCPRGATQSEDGLSCICPENDSHTIWNAQTGKCDLCAQGYYNDNGNCVAEVTCPTGTTLDEALNTCRCDKQQMTFDSATQTCICPYGATYDEETDSCICPDPNTTIDNECSCAFDEILVNNTCTKCGENAVANPEHTQCNCPSGTYRNISGVCLPEFTCENNSKRVSEGCECNNGYYGELETVTEPSGAVHHSNIDGLDYIVIRTKEDLARIGKLKKKGKNYVFADDAYPLNDKYILANDIYMQQDNPNCDMNNPTKDTCYKWEGIGMTLGSAAYNNPFTGVFNGNGHIIHNMYIEEDSYRIRGLFRYTSGAVVKNTGVAESYIKLSKTKKLANTGALIGSAAATRVINCFAIKNKFETSSTTGSLIGYVGSGSVVSNCYAKDNEFNISYYDSNGIGGLIGYLGSKNTDANGNLYQFTIQEQLDSNILDSVALLENSYSSNNKINFINKQSISHNIGGLIGYFVSTSEVRNVYSYNNSIQGYEKNVGGIIGKIAINDAWGNKVNNFTTLCNAYSLKNNLIGLNNVAGIAYSRNGGKIDNVFSSENTTIWTNNSTDIKYNQIPLVYTSGNFTITNSKYDNLNKCIIKAVNEEENMCTNGVDPEQFNPQIINQSAEIKTISNKAQCTEAEGQAFAGGLCFKDINNLSVDSSDGWIYSTEGTCTADIGVWDAENQKCMSLPNQFDFGYSETQPTLKHPNPVCLQCPKGAYVNEYGTGCICKNENTVYSAVDNACICAKGFVSVDNGKCEAVVSCPKGTVYVEKTNSCDCQDSNATWDRYNNVCTCGYGAEYVVDESVENNQAGVCTCANNALIEYKCECNDSQVEIDDLCIDKPECPEGSSFVGKACVCDEGYYFDSEKPFDINNPDEFVCTPCASGSRSNASRTACECVEGMAQWDSTLNACRCERDDMHFDGHECVCSAEGAVYEPELVQCVCAANYYLGTMEGHAACLACEDIKEGSISERGSEGENACHCPEGAQDLGAMCIKETDIPTPCKTINAEGECTECNSGNVEIYNADDLNAIRYCLNSDATYKLMQNIMRL